MLLHLDTFHYFILFYSIFFFYIKSIVIMSSSDGCKSTFKIPIWDMLINLLLY